MHIAHILASTLAVQLQASALVPATSYIQHTERALYAELEKLPRVLLGEQPVDVPEERGESAFDPEPHDALMMASRCKALLLEVVRRAVHDWVLYRNTRKMHDKVLAEDAYLWLFEEKPGHPRWELRLREGRGFLAFLSICENLDLDPEAVRQRARKLTIRDIMTAGRPAETRKVRCEGVEDYETPAGFDAVSVEDFAATHYQPPPDSPSHNTRYSY